MLWAGRRPCAQTSQENPPAERYSSVLTRRRFLQCSSAVFGASATFGGYAIAEPHWLTTSHFHVAPTHWPNELHLKIALLADFHVCDPWMNVDRIHAIVDRTNQLKADMVLLLGDYLPGKKLLRFARPVEHRLWAGALGRLKAPLGVHAVLGNHDWNDDDRAQLLRAGPTEAGLALQAAGIPVYENDAVRLAKDGHPFWLAGLGDQAAFGTPGRPVVRRGSISASGVDDLAGTLMQITDGAPVIMMAHEPDIFPHVPDRVALTVCGHTHGGQVRLPNYAPYVPSRYGTRYMQGHIIEEGRHLVVSPGLGCSAVPLRFGVPPEITIVELGRWSAAALS